MAVKIGHASIDENYKVKGGKPGDQTKKEVVIRDWYNKPWNFVLRPKYKDLAEKSAKFCEDVCKNENIGYNQNKRNTLHSLCKANGYNISKVGPCDTDCSAFMTVCAIAGGAKGLEYTGNAPTTSNMKNKFSKYYNILSDKKYTSSSDYLKRGDILLSVGHHTAMVLTDGTKVKKSVKNKNEKEPIFILVDQNVNCYYKVVGCKALNIRKGPGTNYDIIKSVKANTKYKITEIKDGWAKCSIGWLSTKYLEKV